MDTAQIIWIVVAVVVVAALLLAVTMLSGRRRKRVLDQRHGQAEDLRHEAVRQTSDVQSAELRATEAEAEATLARARAERADQDATEARQEAAFVQARQEDVVREADHLDPLVDDRADDYRPTDVAAPVEQSPGEPAPVEPTVPTHPVAGEQTPGGSHRAEGA